MYKTTTNTIQVIIKVQDTGVNYSFNTNILITIAKEIFFNLHKSPQKYNSKIKHEKTIVSQILIETKLQLYESTNKTLSYFVLLTYKSE